jgi:hypothetical protein
VRALEGFNIVVRTKSRILRRIRGKRNQKRILVGKQEGKRQPGRYRRRWKDKIKIYLREIGWGSVDWIRLAQDRNQ